MMRSQKLGTAFCLMDSLACGALGVLSAGANPLDTMRSMSHALRFLTNHVRRRRRDIVVDGVSVGVISWSKA